ncbi:MAG: tetratricopeptide repeat protein, partial [Candidatus Sumerlaeia bacterium]|nr:tetratricopeptide repeat protein [Candidatus Sumerlaeia bacterium]
YAQKHYRRSQWLPLFGIIFFFISFAPVSNFFKLIGTTMAERLMYLPSIGFCIFFGYFIWQIVGGRERIFYFLFGVFFLFFVSRTFVRNFDWRDDFTLYKATVKATPRCSRAHFNLANHYKKQGKLDEALRHYQLSWEIAPTYGAPLVGVGEILFQQGKFQEAEQVFRQVIRMEERYYPAHHNLAMVLEKMGKYEEAISEYKRTIELRPTEPGPYFNLGLLYLDRDNLTTAKEHFHTALKLQPELYGNLLKIAEQYSREKKWDKAIAILEFSITANPGEFWGYLYLGKVYAILGNKESAVANLKQASALNPQNAEVHYELAKVYLLLVQDERLAYQHFQQVLNLNPQHPDREKILKTMSQLAEKLQIKK